MIQQYEDLARTGTEFPIMRNRHEFIGSYPEYEPLSEKPCPQEKLEEYISRDYERYLNQVTGQLVYDYTATHSPFYQGKADPYIDESDAITLPESVDEEGTKKLREYNLETKALNPKLNRYY